MGFVTFFKNPATYYWMEGMKAILALPEFRQAWTFIADHSKRNGDKIDMCFFRELRWLISKNFQEGTDPKGNMAFHCGEPGCPKRV